MYDNFNTIQIHSYIPQQAFLYFPKGNSTNNQPDDFKLIYQNGKLKRIIYEGGIQYTQQQNQTIDKFYSYLNKKQFLLQNGWSRFLVYKFLQSTNYDYKKTLKEIQNHTIYQNQLKKIDFQKLKIQVQPLLKKGIFYFNGRDSKFRPIIVVNIAKINDLKIGQQLLNYCLIYFFQFVFRYLFINGQVQNIVGIIDIGYTSPLDLIQPMKTTISFLQGNYKYKLNKVFILKTTSMFKFAFSIAKQFMKEDTIRKIQVLNEQIVTPLFQTCNLSQLQKKYGGYHQNLKNDQFWPPKQFSKDYVNPKVQNNLVTIQQYRRLYKQGKLIGRKIYKPYLQDDIQIGDIPLLNVKVPTIKSFKKISQQILSKKEKKGFIFNFFIKLGCNCCGTDINKQIMNQ